MTDHTRTIDGRPLNLRGINGTLFDFAQSCDMFPTDQSFVDDLARSFGSTDQSKRVAAASKVVQRLWKGYPVLGPSPILDVLAEFEFDRMFYPNYRDHSCHVLKVFTLGLSMAHNCPPLRDAIESRYGSLHSVTFKAAWLATAIWHDMGYVLESDAAGKSADEAWLRVKEALNKRLMAPLSATPFYESRVQFDREKQFIKKARIYRPTLDSPADVERDGLTSYFECLSAAAEASALGPTINMQNAIEHYYRFAKSKDVASGNRPTFLDHGVTSALIWLQLWDDYRGYLTESLLPRISTEPIFNRIDTDLRKVCQDIAAFEPFAKDVAGAIALHNIDVNLWFPLDMAAHNFTFDQYQIALYDDPSRGVQAQPLAFLLALADVMQDWDRPRFRPTESHERSGLDADNLDIEFKGQNIVVSFFEDIERYRNLYDPESKFMRLKQNLEVFLQPSAITSILVPSFVDDTTEAEEMAEVSNTSNPDISLPALVSDPINNMLSFSEAKRETEAHSWTVGAVNFDEDLHFSSFYLKQSLASNLGESYRAFGYKTLIAVYRDFNETYYISTDECRSVAERLIQKITKNPLWMQDVLEEIHRRAIELRDVFVYPASSQPFRDMTDFQLLTIYRNHNTAHLRLYEVARIPEALDRGFNIFTEQLKTYLKSRGTEFHSEGSLNHVFGAMTAPEEKNPLGMDQEEFIGLLQRIVSDQQDRNAFSGSTRRRYLHLSPAVIRGIEDYRDRWMYWGYHGYGKRALRDVDFYLERFRSAIGGASEKVVSSSSRFEDVENLREEYFGRYEIDNDHRMLFRLYGRIGAAKVYRRYVQLRNFYFLDQLIGELASRHGVREGVLRCLRPEELEALLEGKLRLTHDHEARMECAVWVAHENKENVFVGDEAAALVEFVSGTSESSATHPPRLLRGHPAFPGGRIRGRCRTVVRANDIAARAFRPGEILIAESTDPDLIELMEQASAVVTQSGGVTAHAAVICRERQIPSVVGVAGLLEFVSDGDILLVDTDAGRIMKIEHTEWRFLVPDLHIKSNMKLGGKAKSLGTLVSKNLNVPAFFAVRLDALLAGARSDDGVGPQAQELWSEVSQALDILGGDLFAIRSSMADEDANGLSAAGRYETELHVMRADVIATMLEVAREVDSRGRGSEGSYIVQEMVLGDVSGIMFTEDPVHPHPGELYIEAVPGGNDLLTDGKVTPARYSVDRNHVVINRLNDDRAWTDLVGDELIHELVAIAQTLEDIFGCPQDVEWTYKNGRLWLLQTRPISVGAGAGDRPESQLRPERRSIQNILAVYRSYRVPPSLQNHMLQVAGIGQWILNRWQGPELDRFKLISALLLHDIGNLVKADYLRFPRLFPAELANLGYWEEMQKWIKTRYGNTDMLATRSICIELGVESDVLELIENKQFIKNMETLISDDYAVKIAAYADQRVSPQGIKSIQDRLFEAVKRYRDIPGASVNHPNRDQLIEAAVEIQKQIFVHIDGEPGDITNTAIQSCVEELKAFILKRP